MDGITITPKQTQDNSAKPEHSSEANVSYPSTSEADSSITKLEVAQQLGLVDARDRKFDFVYNYLARNGESKGTIMKTLRDIEVKLGAPRLGHGESRLGLLYNYLRAEQTFEEASKLRNSYL